MLPGSFDYHTDVRELTTYAIVNGIRREIESVDFDGELSGDLPEQVVSGGGVAGSSGTIVWAAQDDAVEAREVSPWYKANHWPPTGGDRVRIYVTDGTTSWPRFTGVIDRTRGRVGGSYQSTILDDRDKLNRPITHLALLRTHTPLVDRGEYRRIGMNHWYMLARALRRAGIYNTPPQLPGSALSAPMQGTVWSETGTISEAQGVETRAFPAFHRTSWGYAAASAELEYLPATSDTITQTLQVTFMVGAIHYGDAHIRMYYGTNPDHRIRIRVWSDRRVTAYLHNTAVASLSTAQMDGATIVTLLVKGSTWTLRTDTGRESAGTQSRSGTARMSRIEVSLAPASRIAGVQVQRPTVAQEFASLRFSPSMTFDPGLVVASMDMLPRQENRRVRDLVDEICRATLTSAWWDENGVFRLVSAEQLRNRAPVQSITTLDDITELSWEDSLLYVRSQVSVLWKEPIISRSRRSRIELFRGSGDTMDSEDENEVFAVAGNREEWFGVDWNPGRLNDTNWGAYNHRVGSFVGVHYTDADGNELPSSSNTTTIRVERLGNSGLKIHHLAGSYGSGVEANLATSETSGALRQSLRGDNLPVIRGLALGEWADAEDTSPITGPSYAPALEHDLGYWGQRRYGELEGQTSASRLADYIAEMVTVPRPTVERISVMYDPRRQLGDVIDVDIGVLDVQLRALIVGISETHEHGAHTQQLTIRIIEAFSDRAVTYDELAEAWRGGDYNALQAVWANLAYRDFNDDSLRFAPSPSPSRWAPSSAPKYVDINQEWASVDYSQMRSDLADDSYGTFPRDLLEGDSL